MTYFNSPEVLKEWLEKYRNVNPELYKLYINEYRRNND